MIKNTCEHRVTVFELLEYIYTYLPFLPTATFTTVALGKMCEDICRLKDEPPPAIRVEQSSIRKPTL